MFRPRPFCSLIVACAFVLLSSVTESIATEPTLYGVVGGRIDLQFDLRSLSEHDLTVSATMSASGAVLQPVVFSIPENANFVLRTVDGAVTEIPSGVLSAAGSLSMTGRDGTTVRVEGVLAASDPTSKPSVVIRDARSASVLFEVAELRQDFLLTPGFWAGTGDLVIAADLARDLGMPEVAGEVVGRVLVHTTVEILDVFLSVPPPDDSAIDAGEDLPPEGPTVCGTVGPDVIVGDLTGPSNWGSVGSIAAFSIGTTSCNIGDQELLWIDEPGPQRNQHPVIGQSLYRLKDQKFEHIGQSWLKHAFFALQQNLCCTCIPSGNGNVSLGVGCSDPYTSGRNGGQSGLGPKWQVNAHTGDFPDPFQDDGVSGDTIYKRIQVHHADLDAALNPGALYFGEAHYVTPDDAAAGNQDNNTSYRPMTVSPSGGSFALSYSAPTVREQAAVRAWQDTDPTVSEQDVRVPGEGLFILANKPVDLGNGTWRYEYAIQNVNSDRSGQSFSVPFTPGASITDVGFHDVDYHSNDGINGITYDGTDWTAVVDNVANTVTWSTTDFATDPNANALRWGTLYNFRFTSNASPNASTTVTIGLFKPGSPTSITAVTEGPTGGLNILDCNGNGVDDLLDIANGTSADCNGNNIPDECEPFPTTPLDLQLVASGVNRAVYLTSPPNDATRLFVIEQPGRIRIIDNGVLLPAPFLDITALVGGGDAGNDERGLLGMAFHPNYASNGFFYLNYTNNAGDTVIARYTVSANPDLADSGSAATLMTIAQPFSNHNGGWLGFGPDGYLYIATGDGGSANDPGNRAQDTTAQLLGKMLRIDVDGAFPFAIPPDNPFVGVTGDDEIWAYGLRNPWRNSFDRLSGALYIGDVGRDAWEEIDYQPAGSAGGENYGWRCMEGNACTGLTGCTCNDPALTDPIHVYDHSPTGGFSLTGGYVYRGCTIPDLNGTYIFADFVSNNVWSFRYDGTTQTDFQSRNAELAPPGGGITSFGEDADGELYIVTHSGSIYRIVAAASCGNGVIEAGEDCDPPNGTTCDASCQNIPIVCGNNIVQPGEQCDDGNTTNGDGCDQFCQLETVGADACANATVICTGSFSGTTTGTTNDGSSTCASSASSPDVWFSYTPATSGTLTIGTCNFANYDTAFSVHTACPGTTGNEIACDDDGCPAAGTQSQLSVGVVANTTYLIRMTGWNNASGDFTLDVAGPDCTPPITDCNGNGRDDAEDITCGGGNTCAGIPGSFDCNSNGIPDECEGGTTADFQIPVTPPLAVPDGTGVFVTNTFNVSQSGTITDLDVDLLVTHTWNGDLIVTLSHGGTTIDLVNRPGFPVPDASFGFNNDGFDILLDDEGTGGPIEDFDSGGGLVSSPPSFVPNGALSAFDGMDMQGDWTISISDNFSGDPGTLDAWSLHFTLTGGGVPPCPPTGDYVQGGRLYDRWWADLAQTPPATDHPLWAFRPDMTTNAATGAATWRCKECHGWDYLGAAGQYGPSSTHHTGFPGVDATTMTATELITLLTEPPSNGGGAGVLNGHDYGSTSMTTTQMDDLVAFILGGAGVIDETPYINPVSGVFTGSEASGQTSYTTTGLCIGCHGADGTAINFSGDCLNPEYIGTIAALNPWELLHKIRFGQPGQPGMPSWELVGSIQGAADIGKYAQLNFPVECNPNEVGCDQCGDGNVCNGTETCPSGLCVSGTPLVCDDLNACTTDLCDTVTGCTSIPVADGGACVANPPATQCEQSTCQTGNCVVAPLSSGTPCVGNGTGSCTSADTCDGAGACNNNDLPDGPAAGCGDSNVCNGTETCIAGVCDGGTPLVCDDGDPCNGIETCDAVGGCGPGVLINDCNGNLIEDSCDIADCTGDPACGDCNGNGAPDSCDPDADMNGIPDDCENVGGIPTMSDWGAFVMAILLLSAGTVLFGRRRKAASA